MSFDVMDEYATRITKMLAEAHDEGVRQGMEMAGIDGKALNAIQHMAASIAQLQTKLFDAYAKCPSCQPLGDSNCPICGGDGYVPALLIPKGDDE